MYLNVCFLFENLLAVVGGVDVVAAVASITPSPAPESCCYAGPRFAPARGMRCCGGDNVLDTMCYNVTSYNVTAGSAYTKLYRVSTALQQTSGRKYSHIYEDDG